ncbi:hypothetical protein DFJ74DRAFT_737279, partial [Hyaloraphidium curvatum]
SRAVSPLGRRRNASARRLGPTLQLIDDQVELDSPRLVSSAVPLGKQSRDSRVRALGGNEDAYARPRQGSLAPHADRRCGIHDARDDADPGGTACGRCLGQAGQERRAGGHESVRVLRGVGTRGEGGSRGQRGERDRERGEEQLGEEGFVVGGLLWFIHRGGSSPSDVLTGRRSLDIGGARPSPIKSMDFISMKSSSGLHPGLLNVRGS